MKIKDIAYLESFVATLCDVQDGSAASDAAGVSPSVTSMPTPRGPTTLAQTLGAGDRLIDNLAGHYEARGQLELAMVARRLSVVLGDDQLLAATGQEPHRVLTNYIYPVV